MTTTELATQDTQALAIVDMDMPHYDVATMMFNPDIMGRLERFAELMAQGKTTVPAHLRGSVGDCLAVTLQAMQWRMNPHAVAQKTHLVNGTLGYEAQLVNAVINTMAPTKDRLHYEWFGDWDKYIHAGLQKKDEDGLGVRVWATLKGETEPRQLEILLKPITVRNSPNWKSDPRQQIAYLAVKRWSRLYCPDVILGVYTPDELDMPTEKAINAAPQRQSKAASLLSKLAPAPEADAATETLDRVLEKIQDAQTETELAEVEDTAKTLPPAALKTARSAYKDKLASLRAADEQPEHVVDAEKEE
ncbi:RecT family recombinase [Grimontia sp. SpTr1]|uniref:RecT family recombinase n=1 Tax=Grimontia sp. SpTr1 TaxID=2995319 RepID=UPI00248BD2C8|nr:RecT family recombinase [Grimontia sp. SpTr1]